ncbi:bifunctional diaminohydroxyphosphoribosylaminopyrimidine deaminase/5-amino-6-(5-phosphoribosylamino)uracil reductase RibD [Pelagicoccus sp. SDUM812003]|uniref:bifunctional diaminohydroxyphosphoribosylaminopyrimidine deaminase/5-amino-6-(5-phosphoribosylamino)uracil reductase RibD n=1 Tax=Pelagicoccus sp. SDUM812003 TaxID=3041267 RepID=UPI00281098E7|nr:bifunctional diaminohydroxyphosphoribosylaminopyrimidine deaminase/5-amino-6-(5-phosphoribosylamino)uracil reductase RibD [Pelagicoccus sp. SDUM812003]MDQ8204510.1 bifunctional diaminohydroxyphosphoribosylaminopyrimidine deaminase/5-amino-6-(5-phosphoribosylamino)uracil reductase RibD [Pelagicoccus sp. SDUM812003]
MRAALAEARLGWGRTHPQAMIGTVLVEEGKIVARAAVEHPSSSGLEGRLLETLGRKPKPDAALFLTLEPGPSTNRLESGVKTIIDAGIRYVVIGASDPVPDHANKGADALKEGGVKVERRVLIDECEDLNLIFNHWVRERMPIFAAKSATTIDGKIACRSGESKWITGEEARQNVMLWRRLFPSIAVGAGTLVEDDPRLTSRIDGQEEWCGMRFVFDGLLRTAMERYLPSIYTDDYRDNTIVVTTDAAGTGYIRRLETEGVTVWVLPAENMRVPFSVFRKRCFDVGITGVYFEGGSRLVSELLHMRELDYHFNYRAPILLGDDKAKSVYRGIRVEKLSQAIRLDKVRHEVFGNDQLMRGFVSYPARLDVDETVFGHG